MPEIIMAKTHENIIIVRKNSRVVKKKPVFDNHPPNFWPCNKALYVLSDGKTSLYAYLQEPSRIKVSYLFIKTYLYRLLISTCLLE